MPSTHPSAHFKICPKCGDVWPSASGFLSDALVQFIGYQIAPLGMSGAFMFNHGRCGTTLSLKDNAFASLSLIPTLRKSCAVFGRTEEYCLASRDKQPCPPLCPCEDIAQISRAILNWPKNRFT